MSDFHFNINLEISISKPSMLEAISEVRYALGYGFRDDQLKHVTISGYPQPPMGGLIAPETLNEGAFAQARETREAQSDEAPTSQG